jgi:hypothetical protein
VAETTLHKVTEIYVLTDALGNVLPGRSVKLYPAGQYPTGEVATSDLGFGAYQFSVSPGFWDVYVDAVAKRTNLYVGASHILVPDHQVTSTGGDTVNYADLQDQYGNDLPATLTDIHIFVVNKVERASYIKSISSTSFVIAKSSAGVGYGANNDGLVDLLIIPY